MKLSPEMRRCLLVAETTERLVPIRGGYWVTFENAQKYVAGEDGWSIGYFKTTTVYALCARNLLTRLLIHDRSWRDSAAVCNQDRSRGLPPKP